jgi:trehalose 6-phosphate phosphatase
MPIPAIPDHRLALFLDVDGTLIELAETPHAVVVPLSLKTLLNELSIRLDGALALVSGRSVADLDVLFTPFQFIASGVHGCERRDPTGCMVRPQIDASQLASAHAELVEWMRAYPALLLENKSYALAVHYRRAPELESMVRAHLVPLLNRTGGKFELHRGKFVFEIRPSGFSKRNAVHAFMQAPPFAGRVPVFIGDDVTDEDGFAMVNALNGISIRVGDDGPTQAKHRLANVDEAIQWLHALPLPPRAEANSKPPTA